MMDRRYCKTCVYGQWATGKTGKPYWQMCNYVPDKEDTRDMIGNWCCEYRYRYGKGRSMKKEHAARTQELQEAMMADKTFTPADVQEIDDVIQSKHKQGKAYSPEEKERIIGVAEEYGIPFAATYFMVSGNSIRNWAKKEDEGVKATKKTVKVMPEPEPEKGEPEMEIPHTPIDLQVDIVHFRAAMIEYANELSRERRELERRIQRINTTLEMIEERIQEVVI